MKERQHKREVVSTRVLLHQLRNVLQPLQTHVDLIVAHEPQDPGVRQEVARISDDLADVDLFLTRVGLLVRPLELARAEVELKSLLTSLCHSKAQKHAFAAQFSVKVPRCTLLLDELHFSLALGALLDNAIEATAEERFPEITIECELKRSFHLRITDNGKPFDNEVCKRAFEPFVTTKGISGAGLGLAIAQRITDAHGGTLALENGPTRKGVAMEFPKRLIRRSR